MSKKKLTEKQIIDKLRIDENYYGEFGKQWLSNSDIKNLSSNTFKQFGKVEPDNENFVKGRYFHQFILEPKKAKDFPIWSATETRGKAYKEFLEEKGILDKQVTSEEENLDSLRKDLVVRREKLEKLINESSKEKDKLELLRENHRVIVDKNTLTQYDRVYKARNGLAVVNVTESACGGCGAFVPPQVISEVKAQNNIQSCESCSRFLYWETV